jgi:hypothetical protein
MWIDHKSESRNEFVYIPRDESFGHLKSSDFLIYILKSASQNIIPQLRSAVTLNFNNPEYNTFHDVRSLFEGGFKLPTETLSKLSPIPLFKELFRTDGESALKLPPPNVIQGDLLVQVIYFHTIYMKKYHRSFVMVLFEQWISLHGWQTKNLQEKWLLVWIHILSNDFR